MTHLPSLAFIHTAELAVLNFTLSVILGCCSLWANMSAFAGCPVTAAFRGNESADTNYYPFLKRDIFERWSNSAGWSCWRISSSRLNVTWRLGTHLGCPITIWFFSPAFELVILGYFARAFSPLCQLWFLYSCLLPALIWSFLRPLIWGLFIYLIYTLLFALLCLLLLVMFFSLLGDCAPLVYCWPSNLSGCEMQLVFPNARTTFNKKINL